MAATRYSDDEKAAALALLEQSGGNTAIVSYLTGISQRQVQRFANGEQISDRAYELVADKKAALSDCWHELLIKGLAVAHRNIEDCTAAQACTIAAIAADKMLLLRGDPTEIHEQRVITADQAARLSALTPEERDQLEALLAKMDGRHPAISDASEDVNTIAVENDQ